MLANLREGGFEIGEVTVAYAVAGQNERSREALSSALRSDPDFAPAKILLARAKASENDVDGARRLRRR